MQVTYSHCAGLDIHKTSVVACIRVVAPDGRVITQQRTFGTMTTDLLALGTWLVGFEITHVAMESTGEFWKPVYNLLDSSFTVFVVNAAHMKAVPGRKTDVNDAAWIADLLAHGLLRPSFIPPAPQRALRDLTRQRTHLIRERATEVNRMQKVLEWANIKLSSVVTDITGVSARAILEALVGGQTDVTVLADLAKGRLRSKIADLEQALQGVLQPHHAFMLSQHLALIDTFEEQIAAFDTQIAAAIAATRPQPPADGGTTSSTGAPAAQAPDGAAAAQLILDAIPGIGMRAAEIILAELGTDMSRFPSAKHASSWAGLVPGQHESAGKRKPTRLRDGNGYLRATLVQAAWAAVKQADTCLGRFFRRVAARRGRPKAIIAVAHKILVIVYTLLKTGQVYCERPAPVLDDQAKERLVARMQRRIEQLGYRVKLEPVTAGAP